MNLSPHLSLGFPNSALPRDLAEEALANAQNNFPESTLHNGSGDAYRHCYWSGLLTFEFDVSGAKGFGDRHEDYPKNKQFEL
ncbi:6652_t:CDS:2 [Rhizophagus irregularis]|nr:6652_t:CDS:2 [Rhizophagus irregularis]